MKNYFKNILKFIFICLLVTLTSCETEKNVTIESKTIVKRCSLKDANLQKNIKLSRAVDQLKTIQKYISETNSNSKLVYDEITG